MRRRSPLLGLLRRLVARRSVMLGYHGIANAKPSDDLSRLQVPPEQFQRHAELLLAAGFRFVTVETLAALISDGTPPPGLATVSFDDGMQSTFTTAFPIMQRLGLPGTVYVTVGLIGGQNPWVRGPSGKMLTEEQVRQLSATGWEIGAHTMTHPDLATMELDKCMREMRDSRVALERLVGKQVRTFAYPFGSYNQTAVRAAREVGFVAAVTCGSGKWDRYELTRAMVSAGDPSPVLGLKLTDHYEPILDAPLIRQARVSSRRIRARINDRS